MTHPKVVDFLAKAKAWQAEMTTLCDILRGCGLEEDLKWGAPCYAAEGRNIVLVNGFKPHAVLVFPQGALLDDPSGLLVVPGENSRSARQTRFTDLESVRKHEAAIRALVREAVRVSASGETVAPLAAEDVPVPEELTAAFEQEPALKTAFEALTPGRRKAYLLHFGEAAQAKTRIARLEKARDRILCGKGLNDCVCGLSKRMPGCDGSHKALKGT